jgi:hypothetical protein
VLEDVSRVPLLQPTAKTVNKAALTASEDVTTETFMSTSLVPLTPPSSSLEGPR